MLYWESGDNRIECQDLIDAWNLRMELNEDIEFLVRKATFYNAGAN